MPFTQFAPTSDEIHDLVIEGIADHFEAGTPITAIGNDLSVAGTLTVEDLVVTNGLNVTTTNITESVSKKFITNAAQVIDGAKNFTGNMIVGDQNVVATEPTTLTIVHRDSGGHITNGDRIGGINFAGIDNTGSPAMRVGVRIYGEGTGGWTHDNAAPAKLCIICEDGHETASTDPCMEMSHTGVSARRNLTVIGDTNVTGDVKSDGNLVLGTTDPVNHPTANGVVLGSLEGSEISFLRDNANIINAGDTLGSICAYGRDAGFTRKGAEIKFSAKLGFTDSVPRPTRARTKIGFHCQDGLGDDALTEPRVSIAYDKMECDVPLECSETLKIGGGWEIAGVPVTATAGEINAAAGGSFDQTADHVLSGTNTFSGATNLTGTVALGGTNLSVNGSDLNKLDGVTATTAELNLLTGATSLVAENTINTYTSTQNYNGTLQVNGAFRIGATQVTASGAELNLLDGCTALTGDLNKLAGNAVTSADLTKLSGITLTASEINNMAAGAVDWNTDKVFGGLVTAQTSLIIGDGAGQTTELAEQCGYIQEVMNPHPAAVVPGGTQGGLCVTGGENGHLIMRIKANDVNDSFSVISNSVSDADQTPDSLLFQMKRTGNLTIGKNQEVTWDQAAGEFDVPKLSIGGTALNTTAAELNALYGTTDSHDQLQFARGIATRYEIQAGTANLRPSLVGAEWYYSTSQLSRRQWYFVDADTGDLTIRLRYLGDVHDRSGTSFTVIKVGGNHTVKVDTTQDSGVVHLNGSTAGEFYWSGTHEANTFVLDHDSINNIDRWYRINHT